MRDPHLAIMIGPDDVRRGLGTDAGPTEKGVRGQPVRIDGGFADEVMSLLRSEWSGGANA